MNSNKFLKILLILGGIVEIFIGVLFLFLDLVFEQIRLENIPVFTQMAGSFIFCYGILLIYSSINVKEFAIIPLLNIFVRIVMVIFSLINVFQYPEFSIILLVAIPYDIAWSIIVLILMKKERIILKKE